MSEHECWERLHEAVLDLATMPVSPRQRLLAAADRHLVALPEIARRLSDRELADWIDRLMRRLQGRHNMYSRAAVFANINAMSDDEVDEALIEIVAIYDEATRTEALANALVA